ncbi:LVIVD repeat-containing protein [Acidobacteriota bacterium]
MCSLKTQSIPGLVFFLSICTLAVIAAAVPVAAQTCPELVGRWPYGPVMAVAMEGNLVYYGNGAAVIILDISNPSAPQILSEIAMPDAVRDLALSGNYLYVAADAAGLRIVDVSDAYLPFEVGYTETPYRSGNVAVSGSFAYVGYGNGFMIVDISTPQSPQDVSHVQDFTYGLVTEMVALSNYVYLTHWEGRDSYYGLRIFDCTDPLNPREIGFAVTYYGTQSVAVSGDYAYVISQGGPMASPTLYVFHIIDPSNPQMVHQSFYNADPYDLAIAGNYLYWLDTGVRIFDISTPDSPSEVGYCPAPEGAGELAASGSNAGVAAWDHGLRIINSSDPAAPFEESFMESPGETQDVAVRRPFAYLSGSKGFTVIDCTNPSQPVRVGFLGTLWEGTALEVSGSHVYQIEKQDRVGIFRVIDVSEPSQPVILGSTVTASGRDIAVSDNFAYMTNSTMAPHGITVFEVADPHNPHEEEFISMPSSNLTSISIFRSHLYLTDQHDGLLIYRAYAPMVLVGAVDTPGYTRDAAVSGSHAYVADSDYGLRIIDVSRPDSPTEVGAIDIPDSNIDRVCVSGSFLFIYDSCFPPPAFYQLLRVIDVSNPSSPVEINAVPVPRIRNFKTSGSYLYIVSRETGMSIYDISGCCTEAPDPVVVLSPVDGDISQRDTLLLDWEDSPSAFYDIYLDAFDPPTTLIATDLSQSELTVALQPATTYYWSVEAKNACGTTASAIYSFTTYTDNIYRFDSRASFTAHTPTDTFPSSSLPWTDPDNVLDPSAPPLLYYDVSFWFDPVAIVKDGTTIRIAAN